MELYDNKTYEVVNPKTGQREMWTGERIRIYKIVYGGDIVEAPKRPITPKVKKRTSKSTETKSTTKIESDE